MKRKLGKVLCIIGAAAWLVYVAYGAYHMLTHWDRTCELAHKAYAQLPLVAFTVDITLFLLPPIAIVTAVLGILCCWRKRFEEAKNILSAILIIPLFLISILVTITLISNAREVGMRLRERRLAREARTAQEAAAQTNETATVTVPEQTAPAQ